MKSDHKRIFDTLQKTKADMEDLMEATDMQLYDMRQTLAAEVQKRQAAEAELKKFTSA